jgi:hypothetical protein
LILFLRGVNLADMRNLGPQEHPVGEVRTSIGMRDVADLQNEFARTREGIRGLRLDLFENRVAAGIHCRMHIGEGFIAAGRDNPQIGIELRDALAQSFNLYGNAIIRLHRKFHTVYLGRPFDRSLQQRRKGDLDRLRPGQTQRSNLLRRLIIRCARRSCLKSRQTIRRQLTLPCPLTPGKIRRRRRRCAGRMASVSKGPSDSRRMAS